MSKLVDKSLLELEVFNLESFTIWQHDEVMKVSTDAILLGAWADHEHFGRILDIGTGTGILAMIMAEKYSQAKITAVDIDPNACQIAQLNAEKNGRKDRVKVVNADFQAFSSDQKYDIIISNPPFFNRKDLYDQSARQGSRNALSLPHGVLLRNVSQMIAKDGVFMLILPYLEGLRFIELAEMYSLFPVEVVYISGKVNQKPNRLLIKLNKASEKKEVKEKSFAIRKENGEYTPEFNQLARPYYKKQ